MFSLSLSFWRFARASFPSARPLESVPGVHRHAGRHPPGTDGRAGRKPGSLRFSPPSTSVGDTPLRKKHSCWRWRIPPSGTRVHMMAEETLGYVSLTVGGTARRVSDPKGESKVNFLRKFQDTCLTHPTNTPPMDLGS